MVCPLSKWVNFHVLGIGHVFQDGIMRLLRKIKYILVAGAAGGVLASYLVVHPSICEAPFEEKKKEDPGLFIHQKPRSKWDANWDRWTFSCQYHFSSCLYQQSGNVFFFFFVGGSLTVCWSHQNQPLLTVKRLRKWSQQLLGIWFSYVTVNTTSVESKMKNAIWLPSVSCLFENNQHLKLTIQDFFNFQELSRPTSQGNG